MMEKKKNTQAKAVTPKAEKADKAKKAAAVSAAKPAAAQTVKTPPAEAPAAKPAAKKSTKAAPSPQPVTRKATKKAAEAAPSPRVTATAESDRQPIRKEEIERLAYSYAEARGFQGGSPEEDWFRAEQELRTLRGR